VPWLDYRDADEANEPVGLGTFLAGVQEGDSQDSGPVIVWPVGKKTLPCVCVSVCVCVCVCVCVRVLPSVPI
jgi:hypothetical protein